MQTQPASALNTILMQTQPDYAYSHEPAHTLPDVICWWLHPSMMLNTHELAHTLPDVICWYLHPHLMLNTHEPTIMWLTIILKMCLIMWLTIHLTMWSKTKYNTHMTYNTSRNLLDNHILCNNEVHNLKNHICMLYNKLNTTCDHKKTL